MSLSDAALGWVQPSFGAALPAAARSSSLLSASAASEGGAGGWFSSGRRVISAGWSWLSEHRRGVLGGAAVAAAVGGYVVYRKVQPILAQLRSELAMVEQLSAQLNPSSAPAQKHALLLHRLEHNLAVGDVTLRQFAMQLRKDLMMRFDVDEIRSRMKKSASASSGGAGGSSGRTASDYALWDEFKVAGFSRTLSAMYACAMIHALVKLQLALVGRYVMFDQEAARMRQEAEQAARENPLGGPAAGEQAPGQPGAAGASAAADGSLGAAPLPAFLPPAACDEINRLYFSLSRHAQTLGAAQLGDHVAILVAQELQNWNPALAGQVTLDELRERLWSIHGRVQREALGLECKTDVEAGVVEGGEEAAGAASASGSSPATTVFASSEPYVRFLLPPSAALTALLTSVSSGAAASASSAAPTSAAAPSVASAALSGEHVANMSSYRLAEMLGETNAVLCSGAMKAALVASMDAVMEEMLRAMELTFPPAAAASSGPAAAAQSSRRSIPFASALVAVIKLFATFLPDVASLNNNASAAAGQVASPLFQALSDLPAVKELCAVIYLPADVVTSSGSGGAHGAAARSTMQLITDNKTFAGNPAAAVAASAQSQLRIEEVKAEPAADASASSGAAGESVPLSRALQDVRGLPVFDRL